MAKRQSTGKGILIQPSPPPPGDGYFGVKITFVGLTTGGPVVTTIFIKGSLQQVVTAASQILAGGFSYQEGTDIVYVPATRIIEVRHTKDIPEEEVENAVPSVQTPEGV